LLIMRRCLEAGRLLSAFPFRLPAGSSAMCNSQHEFKAGMDMRLRIRICLYSRAFSTGHPILSLIHSHFGLVLSPPGTTHDRIERCGLIPLPFARRVFAGMRILVWSADDLVTGSGAASASASSSSSSASASGPASASGIAFRRDWAALCAAAGAVIVDAPPELLRAAAHAEALRATADAPATAPAHATALRERLRQLQRQRWQRAPLDVDCVLIDSAPLHAAAKLMAANDTSKAAAAAAAGGASSSGRSKPAASREPSAPLLPAADGSNAPPPPAHAALGPLGAQIMSALRSPLDRAAATVATYSRSSSTPSATVATAVALVDKQWVIDCLVLQRRMGYDECAAYAPGRAAPAPGGADNGGGISKECKTKR
jgi:hypothetical protein